MKIPLAMQWPLWMVYYSWYTVSTLTFTSSLSFYSITNPRPRLFHLQQSVLCRPRRPFPTLQSTSTRSDIRMNHTVDDIPVFQEHATNLPSSLVIPSQSFTPTLETETEATSYSDMATTATFYNTKHVMNAMLLIVCFSFVSYTIFNVDHGMTRGWTLEEKAMRIPLDNWASYESSLNTQPVITKTAINVIIYLLGDWASQTIFVKKNIVDFDAMRTFRNGFIGLCFGPLVHQYYEFSDAILPVEVGINRFYKICMDQTIYLAVKCSIYIMAVNVLSGETFQTGKNKIQDKLQGIMFTAWKFWPLVHLITYNVIPARHRILWVNCVDLIWNAILSLRTNSNDTSLDTKMNDHEKSHGENNLEIPVEDHAPDETMDEPTRVKTRNPSVTFIDVLSTHPESPPSVTITANTPI